MLSKMQKDTETSAYYFEECQNCHKTNTTDTKLLRCANCHIVKYCSIECQKAQWPEHKKVCEIKVETVEAEEIVPTNLQEELDHAAALQTGQRDLAIYGAALKCLNLGLSQTANKYIQERTTLSSVREKYFTNYAYKMLVDVTKTDFVLLKGKALVGESKALQIVVQELTRNNHTKEACKRASVCSVKQQSLLLEIVASQLMMENKFGLAEDVIATVPDVGTQRDLLEILQTFPKDLRK